MRRIACFILSLALAVACDGPAEHHIICGDAPIYPDYIDVTVPYNIAPLNFDYRIPADDAVTVFSCGDMSVSFKGPRVRWNERKWHRLLAVAKGGDVKVQSTAMDSTWAIHVSDDAIDYGIDYRLIEPGYEVYSKMGIYERELGSFRQRALIENTDFSGCVNCHAYNRCSPEDFSLHIRGDHGATLLRLDGNLDAYNTKTDSTLGFCVYPYWHPSGDFIAYSTNSTRQLFHVHPEKLIEVFDMDSDLLVYDIRNNRLSKLFKDSTKEFWETFPSFSPDGKTIYFCAAGPKTIPDSLSAVRYNLYRAGFDPITGKVTGSPELMVDAASEGKSISFPRPSFDGRFLMYTLSDYGQFSIWHHESDLWLIDLRYGTDRPLCEANSPDTESYHDWSSSSRWFVFSSRRDDGLFTRPYFSHIDEDGNVGKAFMLPQREPSEYYEDLYLSYNVPEFVTGPVKYSHRKASRLINSTRRVQFDFE